MTLAALAVSIFDIITAAISIDSPTTSASSRSSSSLLIRSQGSPVWRTPASFRRRAAVRWLILPSSADSAPAMSPGKDMPTLSSSSANSSITWFSVSRST